MKRRYMISPAAMEQWHAKRARTGMKLIPDAASPELVPVGWANSLTVA